MTRCKIEAHPSAFGSAVPARARICCPACSVEICVFCSRCSRATFRYVSCKRSRAASFSRNSASTVSNVRSTSRDSPVRTLTTAVAPSSKSLFFTPNLRPRRKIPAARLDAATVRAWRKGGRATAVNRPSAASPISGRFGGAIFFHFCGIPIRP